MNSKGYTIDCYAMVLDIHITMAYPFIVIGSKRSISPSASRHKHTVMDLSLRKTYSLSLHCIQWCYNLSSVNMNATSQWYNSYDIIWYTKNNWRGRLLKYTYEFNEWTYKCYFCAKDIIRKLTRKFNNLPRPLEVGLRHRKLIPKKLTYVEKNSPNDAHD